MTDRAPANIVASIHQRLLNLAHQIGRSFNDLVLYYAIERFLYRLSQSPFADRVILKGGLMLQVWNAPAMRVTRDIDLLGRLNNDPEQIRNVVRAVCSIAVGSDGLLFDPQTVATVRIAEDADYEGVRATFRGRFGNTPLAMQVDFGFSDVITPAPVSISYPTMLDHAPARLLAYTRETVVAEKFEAMVKLAELNSRMKDFFDVWVLAESFPFEGPVLADAIRSTFARRGTAVAPEPICFSERFASTPAKLAQWKGFVKRARVSRAPSDFPQVVAQVRAFLQPVAEAIAGQRDHDRRWRPGEAWVAS